MKTFLHIIFSVVLLITNCAVAQTTLWSYNFNSDANGATTGLDLNAPAGADWTCADAGASDKFEKFTKTFLIVFGSEEIFGGENIASGSTWTSEAITITDYITSISMTVRESGGGPGETVTVQYSLDGGPYTNFTTNGVNTGNFGDVTASVSGLDGTSVVIRVTFEAGNNDWVYIDNILVTGTPVCNPCYAVLDNGDWDDPNTWAETSGGAPNVGIPYSESMLHIGEAGALTVNFNMDGDAKELTIYNGSVLKWTTDADINIFNTGTLDIQSGATFDADGNIINVEFEDATTSTVNVDGTLNVENFQLNSTGIVNISGSGTLSIADDFNLNDAGTVNNSLPDFTIGDNINFTNGAASFSNSGNITVTNDIYVNAGNTTLSNSGTLLVTDDITFDEDNITITNTGTFTADDIIGVDSGDDGNVFNNNAGIVNINNIDPNDGDFILNNLATINMTGDFVNNKWDGTGDGIYNKSGGVLNFSGNASETSKAKFKLYANYANNTVNYNRNGDQDILPYADNYMNLKISGTSGTKTWPGGGAGNLDIDGNVDIIDGARLDPNAKDVELGGNWTNNSTNGDPFIQGTNAVIFNGGTDQLITNANSETFNNITIAQSGAFEVNLANGTDITINGAATFTAGLIDALTNDQVVNFSASGTSGGGSATSYIKGKSSKAGSSAFIFPVGDADRFAPIEISAPVIPFLSSTFLAEYLSEPHVDNLTLDIGLNNVSDREYWTLDRTAGLGLIAVTLHWTSGDFSGITGPTPDLIVSRYTGLLWINELQGAITGTQATGTVTSSTPTTGFGAFGFGSTNGANPLPVELLSFSTIINGDGVDVEWSTATEINNDYFTLEKSIDGRNFEEVLRTDGAGNSSEERNYFEVDYDLWEGKTYYRLKQTDFDGKFTYSKITGVVYNGNHGATSPEVETKLNLYPNPSNGLPVHVHMEGFGVESEILVAVRDLQGRELFSKILVSDFNGEVISAIDPDNVLPVGTYLVTGSADNRFFSKKLIISGR